MSDTQMLIVAGYPDVDVAEAEFRALTAKVAAKELSSQGMILVGKDTDGEPRLMDTGNHLGRRGALRRAFHRARHGLLRRGL